MLNDEDADRNRRIWLSSGCWLHLASLASFLHFAVIAAESRAAWHVRCASSSIHHFVRGNSPSLHFTRFMDILLCIILSPCPPTFISPYLIPFLLETLCCECMDGMCRLCVVSMHTLRRHPLSLLSSLSSALGLQLSYLANARPCSEWFVLRSSSLFLLGALEQICEQYT